MPRTLFANLDLRTGDWLPAAPDGGVLLTSRDLAWRGLTAEVHAIGPAHQPAHTVQTHRLMVHLGRPARFEFRDDGDRWRAQVLQPSDVSFVAHGGINEPRWHDRMEFLAIGLDPELVERILGAAPFGGSMRSEPIRGRTDPVVAAIAGTMRRELARPLFPGRLFGETLAVSLARHLVARSEGGRSPVRGALTGAQIGRVMTHLREHMGEDVGLEALAAQAHVSPFHFSRLFRAATGLPPHQFVLRLRIDHARQLIRTARGTTLAEVAVASGFFDQSHFTRTFRRIVGVTPSTFAAQT